MKFYYMTAFYEHFRNYDAGFDGVDYPICEPQRFTVDEVGFTKEEIAKWAAKILREYIADANAEITAEEMKALLEREDDTGEDERYTLQIWEYESEEDFGDETDGGRHLPRREPDFDSILWFSAYAKEALEKREA